MQELATDLKLSLPQTQKLIDTTIGIFKRHDVPILIHKKALSMKNACSRFIDDTHTIRCIGMELPCDFFGIYENEQENIKLKPILFSLFDIEQELGKALLDMDPEEFIFDYKEVM